MSLYGARYEKKRGCSLCRSERDRDRRRKKKQEEGVGIEASLDFCAAFYAGMKSSLLLAFIRSKGGFIVVEIKSPRAIVDSKTFSN